MGDPLMLRITVQESPESITLVLEGRLAGPWIREAERAWTEVARKGNGRRRVVDLSGVTYVEEGGKRLLLTIVAQDGELRAGDVMTKAIVEEVQGKRAETESP
jgi:anti-anti-sigma regulatory factor